MTNIPKSIRSETKSKFETLLKNALNSKSNLLASPKSTRTVFMTSENKSSSSFEDDFENDCNTTRVEVDIHVTKKSDDENFILNKFLTDNDNTNLSADNDTTSAIMPMPKPRKKWVKHSTSREKSTKSQTSATKPLEYFLTNERQSSSLSSVQTYIVSDNHVDQISGRSGSISSGKIDEELLPVAKSKRIDDNDHHKKSDNEINKHQKPTHPAKPKMRLEENTKNFTEVNVSLESLVNSYCSTNLSEKSDGGNEKQITTQCENTENAVLAEEFQSSENIPILEIVIHRTDKLKLESFAIRRAVKVHIVNEDTGEYLQKSDFSRSRFVATDKNVTYIEPIMTRPLHVDLNEKLHRFPIWEESLIVNEDFQYFLSENHNLIIFFELLSFIPLPVNRKVSKEWYEVAWAFLKPKGKFDSLNVEKMVRLQLYYPGNSYITVLPKCHIFEWWNSIKKRKYPSTLYVTIKELKLPRLVIEKFKSKNTLPLDKSIINVVNQNKKLENRPKDPRRYCNFPNKLLAKFYSYELGCLAIKFSNNGLYLACGMSQEVTFFIAVFSTETFEQIFKFSGHEGLIYDIKWSKNDEFIISASSDCTVCIWNFETKKFIQILPHMSFVYCCAMINDEFVITGGYDKILKIWTKYDYDDYKLFQEIENHEGFITSVCVKGDASAIYSSDSKGKIVECTLDNKSNHHWEVNREIILAELKGTIINQILLNNKETKLVVHARDSVLRLMDLKTLCVLQRFTQALNNTVQTFCSFCNCSKHLFCSSENGFIHVWDISKGNSVAKYMPYCNIAPYKDMEIHNVQFNPKKTQIAVASYDNEVPVLLCGFDEQYKLFDLGLRHMPY